MEPTGNTPWRRLLVAGADPGPDYTDPGVIYRSADGGATWAPTTAPDNSWRTLACSADGIHLAAGAYGGPIFLSSDSGVTWAPASAPSRQWTGIACSADGTRLVAAARNDLIYFSADSGVTWTPTDSPTAQWASRRLFRGRQPGGWVGLGRWHLFLATRTRIVF
jgi:photosystem II stability/assembly factor-like uncharacterized protein